MALMQTAMLHNEATDRYHPICFRPVPRPSDDYGPGRFCRHRSAGHHEQGFDSLDAAKEWLNQYPDQFHQIDVLLKWDGAVEPATTLDLEMLQ